MKWKNSLDPHVPSTSEKSLSDLATDTLSSLVSTFLLDQGRGPYPSQKEREKEIFSFVHPSDQKGLSLFFDNLSSNEKNLEEWEEGLLYSLLNNSYLFRDSDRNSISSFFARLEDQKAFKSARNFTLSAHKVPRVVWGKYLHDSKFSGEAYKIFYFDKNGAIVPLKIDLAGKEYSPKIKPNGAFHKLGNDFLHQAFVVTNENDSSAIKDIFLDENMQPIQYHLNGKSYFLWTVWRYESIESQSVRKLTFRSEDGEIIEFYFTEEMKSLKDLSFERDTI